MQYLLFVFAFLIRLINLNQSLWLDEATTARVIEQYSHFEILTKFSPFDFHPPLYYLFMKSWSLFFGYSEIALRMPSIIFSLLAGYVIYLICRLSKNFGDPLWAAAFFLFNPLIVYYSQETRPYIMTTFLLTASLFYLIKMLQAQNSKLKTQNQILKLKTDLILFNVFIVLSLFTFYGSLFLVITFLLCFLYKKQYKNLFICLFVVFFYFLIISPLLYQQLINAKILLSTVTNWNLALGKANLKNLLLIPVKFSIGRIDFYPKLFYYLVAGLWTGLILYQISPLRSSSFEGQAKSKKLYYFLLIMPLILGFVVSFVTPMLQYFRFLYLVPVMAILLSFHCSATMKKIFFAGFLIFSFIYLLMSQFHREDWRRLVKNLPQNLPIYMIKSSSDPVSYYNPRLNLKDLRSLLSSSSLSRELIVIPYTAEIYGYNYQEKLAKKNYKLEKEITFRNLYFEQWNKQ